MRGCTVWLRVHLQNGTNGEKSACQCQEMQEKQVGSWGTGRSLRGNGNLLAFLPDNPMDRGLGVPVMGS